MKIKKRLFYQSILTLLLSLGVTALILVCFFNIYFNIKSIPTAMSMHGTMMVATRDSNLVYYSSELSSFDAKKIIIASKCNTKTYKLNNTEYYLQTENAPDGTEYIVLEVRPPYYSIFLQIILISVILFAVVYFFVLAIIQKENYSDIIKPLTDLKKQTEILTTGELRSDIADEGYGEVNDLCKAVDNLRVRLKEQVYFNKKTEENRKFLISSISHDLRTPVTSLRGYIEGITDGVADTKEKQELYLKRALEKITLINHMIEDLLLYSKLDLNQIPFKMQYVDVCDFIRSVVEDNSHIFENSNKTLTFENNLENKYFVYIDVEQFARVLRNVMENAYKYIDEVTGKAEVILRENISSVIIEIKDNGSGIAKEDISKIFDKFYRCEKQREIKGSSGLGLAISKQIVEGMNGRIWAVSEQGEGTSVMISLKKSAERKENNEENTDNRR